MIHKKRGMRPILAGLMLVLWSGGCLTTPAQELSYQDILDLLVSEGVPGAVLLVRTPTSEFKGVSGYADRENKVPMDTTHLFRIASTSKSFIGVLAVMLHGEGVISLDDPLTKWLPSEISAHFQYAQRITVRQLLNHTSGIYDYGENDAFWDTVKANPTKEWSTEEVLSYAYDQPAHGEPGTDWYYSNTNYVLAGLVIDNALGYHHSEAIRTRILERLEMTSTFYEHHDDVRGEIVHGYSDYDKDGVIENIPFDQGYGLADSGLLSTVEDLSIFLEALFTDTDFPTSDKASFLKELLPEGDDFYGLGIMKYPTEYCTGYGNGGTFCGYESAMMYFPDQGVTIVYFVNGTGPRLDRAVETFFNRILQKTFSPSKKIDLTFAEAAESTYVRAFADPGS